MKSTRGRKQCLRPGAEVEEVEEEEGEEDGEVVSEEAQIGGSDSLKGNICCIILSWCFTPV